MARVGMGEVGGVRPGEVWNGDGGVGSKGMGGWGGGAMISCFLGMVEGDGIPCGLCSLSGRFGSCGGPLTLGMLDRGISGGPDAFVFCARTT